MEEHAGLYRAVAQWDNEPEDGEDDLAFSAGETIVVLEESVGGSEWALGRLPDAKAVWSPAMMGNLKCRQLSCVTLCRA